MKSINPEIQRAILSLLEDGCSIKKVAEKVPVSVSTISRLWTKYMPDLVWKSPGRRPILSGPEKKVMKRQALCGASRTIADVYRCLKRKGKDISYWTVRNHLKNIGLETERKVKKPFLSKVHKRARYKCAMTHQGRTAEDWKRVIFSEETKINVCISDGI